MFTPEMVQEINEQIDHLCTLTFKKEELDYLRSIRFIKDDYVEFLRLWRPIRDYVTAELKDGELVIEVNGPLSRLCSLRYISLKLSMKSTSV